MLRDGLRSRPSQATQKLWDYVRYDGLGRPVVRGTVRNTASHTALLSLFQTKLVCERYTGNGLTGYSTDVSLGQNESPLEVYYYDCYSFLTLSPFNTLRERVATSDTLWRALGRMTGKYIRSMRDEATCEVSLLAYDARGREVLRRSDNGVNGIARTDSVSYGVRGNALSHTEKYACVNDTLSLRTQYAYDAALRPVAATLNVEASARHGAEDYRYETSLFTASYDSYGRLSASTSLAGQGQTAYSYGYGGRRESMSVGGGVYGETLHYDDNGPSEPRADGRITGITMQRGTDNKIADIKYDAFGRLSEGVISSASSPTLSEMYVYDTSGNVEQVDRSVGGVVLNDAVLWYEGHRLTQIEENAPTAGASTSHALHIPYCTDNDAYSYDADGRETRNLTRGVERAVYAGSNLRPDSLCFSGGNALCFGYMSDGRMVEVETRTSQTPLVIPPDVYNAQGDPVFIHHEWREGSVSRSSEGFFKVEVPGGYLVIGKEQVTGFAHGSPEYSRNITPYCYVSDYLGSIRAVIRATDGSVVQRADYMPSGACYAEENASLQPRRFCGKELFTVHGYMTYDSGARMLDGGLPRFNAPDPFQEKYYGLSSYAYCAGDAVNLVDPWGEEIRVVINGKTYTYRDINGRLDFYDANDKPYDGNDIFIQQLRSALASIMKTQTGSEIVNFLIALENVLNISSTTKPSQTNDEELYWNYRQTDCGRDINGSYKTLPEIILAHELGHVYAHWLGIHNDEVWIPEDTMYKTPSIKKSEIYASHVENVIRTEMGLPLREYYANLDNGVMPESLLVTRSGGQYISTFPVPPNNQYYVYQINY